MQGKSPSTGLQNIFNSYSCLGFLSVLFNIYISLITFGALTLSNQIEVLLEGVEPKIRNPITEKLLRRKPGRSLREGKIRSNSCGEEIQICDKGAVPLAKEYKL